MLAWAIWGGSWDSDEPWKKKTPKTWVKVHYLLCRCVNRYLTNSGVVVFPGEECICEFLEPLLHWHRGRDEGDLHFQPHVDTVWKFPGWYGSGKHTVFKASFSVCCMIFQKFWNKSHNMKAFIIISHSWSPFFLLTYLFGENELLWGPVCPFGVFSWEVICNETLLQNYPCPI